MKRWIMLALVSIVLVILGGSIASFLTIPQPVLRSNPTLDLGQMVNYPSLPQGNFTFQYLGTQASFSTLANFAIGNWTSDIPHGFQLIVKKDSQALKFPFTNTTLVAKDVSLTVNGRSLALTSRSISTQINGTVMSLFYMYTPQQNFNGSIMVNISFEAYYVVLAGIYHLSIYEGKQSISKELTLLS